MLANGTFYTFCARGPTQNVAIVLHVASLWIPTPVGDGVADIAQQTHDLDEHHRAIGQGAVPALTGLIVAERVAQEVRHTCLGPSKLLAHHADRDVAWLVGGIVWGETHGLFWIRDRLHTCSILCAPLHAQIVSTLP